MKQRSIAAMQAAVFVLCLLPLARLAAQGFSDGLGANPIEVITHSTGWWALTLLMATLAVTPLRKLSGQPWLIRFRRMLGLFAFLYATLHFVTYLWLDKFFDLGDIVKDVGRRPFITVGFTAFVLLIPLAVTSTRRMIQRLGGRRWQRLHRLVYVSAAAGGVHFLWLVKKDISEPALFLCVLAALLGYRVLAWAWKARVQPRGRHATAAE
jgi:sulfoxide reductase heme-binding subunit YedZ